MTPIQTNPVVDIIVKFKLKAPVSMPILFGVRENTSGFFIAHLTLATLSKKQYPSIIFFYCPECDGFATLELVSTTSVKFRTFFVFFLLTFLLQFALAWILSTERSLKQTNKCSIPCS